MQRIRTLVLFICGLALLAACSNEASNTATSEFESVDLKIQSRGVAIPATFVAPKGGTGAAFPLVVMAHGHGGSRHEAGGFQQVAAALAEQGVASIRVDFPGCGDSTESFANNNLSNMLLDMQAAREYAASQPSIDSERIGLLGYSMGGRVVALLSEQDPSYMVMTMWAPSVADGAAREIASEFGGPDDYAATRQRALESGSVVYTTRWGTQLELGPRWFTDLEETFPRSALEKFAGPLLVIYGDADESVSPSISATAVTAATNSREVVSLVIPGARHALGIYTNRPEILASVVATTAGFFSERL